MNPLNDTQCRILTILKNIGGEAEPVVIQQRGNLSKPVDVINVNMRQMVKAGYLDALDGGAYRIKVNGTDQQAVKKQAKRGGKSGGTNKRANAAIKSLGNDKPEIRVPLSGSVTVTAPGGNSAVGELEDDVQRDEKKISNVLSAIERLDAKARADRSPQEQQVEDFQLKYDLLSALARMTTEVYGEDSISQLLHEIRDDLTFLKSLCDD